MTTQPRIDANRANAQHSTGPKTDEGKAASFENARKNDREAFEDLRAGFYIEIDPAGILEQTEFDTLVEAAWKLQVVRRLEQEALEQNEANAETILDRFSRYTTRLQRIYHRAMAELRRLQTERSIREKAAIQNAALAPLADTARVQKQTQPQPPINELDDYARQLKAEATWTNAQIRALRQGVRPPAAPPAAQHATG